MYYTIVYYNMRYRKIRLQRFASMLGMLMKHVDKWKPAFTVYVCYSSPSTKRGENKQL
jgi:hypothetical protein